MKRSSGILLHITALPGGHGIGDMGPSAYRWIDFLSAAQQQYWQILPLTPPGYGFSPYSSNSSFAGNPLIISLDSLVEDRLLSRSDLRHENWNGNKVEFQRVEKFKTELMLKAYATFKASGPDKAYDEFVAKNSWLAAYATRIAAATEQEPGFVRFQQYVFYKQWQKLKAYAGAHGIHIIGDLPMYVASDCIECDENPDLFDKQSGFVAGAPPCNMYPNGQSWGNPLYRWDKHREQGFKWWLDRVKSMLEQVDAIRLDYFCGYHASWATNGNNGHWREGPRGELFQRVRATLGNVPFIAEDLGLLTHEIHHLRNSFGIMSTKVLQYAFDGLPDNPYLPENYTTRHCVVYTGTHDNDTTRGWFHSTPEHVRQNLKQSKITGHDVAWDMIKLAGHSIADLIITPYQDVLCLDSDARFNVPGTVSSQNWSWRVEEHKVHSSTADALAWLARHTDRMPTRPSVLLPFTAVKAS
jgi:4-alpha-glucanotransferase